jgi:hypothetical protein
MSHAILLRHIQEHAVFAPDALGLERPEGLVFEAYAITQSPKEKKTYIIIRFH